MVESAQGKKVFCLSDLEVVLNQLYNLMGPGLILLNLDDNRRVTVEGTGRDLQSLALLLASQNDYIG